MGLGGVGGAFDGDVLGDSLDAGGADEVGAADSGVFAGGEGESAGAGADGAADLVSAGFVQGGGEFGGAGEKVEAAAEGEAEAGFLFIGGLLRGQGFLGAEDVEVVFGIEADVACAGDRAADDAEVAAGTEADGVAGDLAGYDGGEFGVLVFFFDFAGKGAAFLTTRGRLAGATRGDGSLDE